MVSTLECAARMPSHETIFRSFYIFSPVLILLILSIYFFLSINFSFLIFTKKIIKKTISIVECEALGMKCSEHFFEQELYLKGIGIFMSNITVITRK